MDPLRRVGAWVADRLGLRAVIRVVARHPVPPETTSPGRGWMYVFGSATLAAFLLQVVTGIALASLYSPAPAEAHANLVRITEEVRYGAFLRGLHFFGASAMVTLLVVHALRVFLTGSFKFPRRLNWISGVVLLLLTGIMAFTGQLLRWDANGIWGVFVASHYAARVPFLGDRLFEFILAGDTVGGATLSRFFAFHVIVVPLLIGAVIAVHLYLVFRNGISEPPKPGHGVDPKRYRAWYDRMLAREGRPYVPHSAWREAVFSALVIGVVIGLALVVGPKGPAEPADPTFIPAAPKPDWFLLWYYGLIAIKPPTIETFVMVYLPLILTAILIVLPFVSHRGERSPRRRPGSILAVGIFVTAFGVLTELGHRSPWVMDFETRALTAAEVGVDEGPIWEGAQLFHEKGCQYCHAVAGRGGTYGPALTGISSRLPRSIITARIVQGYGNMPAYREMLSREELSAILAFLLAVEDE